jgi:hypothetical protein
MMRRVEEPEVPMPVTVDEYGTNSALGKEEKGRSEIAISSWGKNV